MILYSWLTSIKSILSRLYQPGQEEQETTSQGMEQEWNSTKQQMSGVEPRLNQAKRPETSCLSDTSCLASNMSGSEIRLKDRLH